jgi:hypothetical protein
VIHRRLGMRLSTTTLILTRLMLAVLLALTPFKTSQALEMAPEPMQRAIPQECRTPFARFLQELGATNVEEMLNSTKVGFLFTTGPSSAYLGVTGYYGDSALIDCL